MKDNTKRNLVFILSVGVAFYAGMKFAKPKVKIVRETVYEKDTSIQIVLNACNRAQKECIERYDILVDEANTKIKDLEERIDTCEEKYYIEPKSNYPEKNLFPEKVEEKEPEMLDYDKEQKYEDV